MREDNGKKFHIQMLRSEFQAYTFLRKVFNDISITEKHGMFHDFYKILQKESKDFNYGKE